MTWKLFEPFSCWLLIVVRLRLVWNSFFSTNKAGLFWVLDSVPHRLWVFPDWLLRTGTVYGPAELRLLFPCYPKGWPGVVSSHHTLISTLLHSLRGSFLDLWSLTFGPLSLLQDSSELSCECYLPWFPPIFSCIHLPQRVFCTPWSPFPCFVAWKCSWGSKAHFTCSLTQGSLFFVAWWQCLENCCFLIFCPFFFSQLFQVGS